MLFKLSLKVRKLYEKVIFALIFVTSLCGFVKVGLLSENRLELP